MSEIVQRCGMRALAEPVESAARVLNDRKIRLVILDADGSSDWLPALESITVSRRTTGTSLPRLILLWNRTGAPENASISATVDEIVAKPVTPERLQPVIMRLLTEPV